MDHPDSVMNNTVISPDNGTSTSRWNIDNSPGWTVDWVGAATEPLTPPRDLREWVDPGTLINWLDEEAAGLETSNGRAPGAAQSATLRLLAFAYASQVFESSVIARKCRAELAFHLLCGGIIPFPHELTRFRRRNREAIAKLMARLYARAFPQKWGRNGLSLTESDASRLKECAIERLDIARHMDEWV